MDALSVNVRAGKIVETKRKNIIIKRGRRRRRHKIKEERILKGMKKLSKEKKRNERCGSCILRWRVRDDTLLYMWRRKSCVCIYAGLEDG